MTDEIITVVVSNPGTVDAAIILPGQTTPTQKRYKYAFQGMTFSAGDRAYAVKVSGTYILIGGAVSGGELYAMANELGIVINGSTCALGASAGQFVVLRNSTIPNRADGLYTAAAAIPAGKTNVSASDLNEASPITEGGLNALSRDTGWQSLVPYLDTSTMFDARPNFLPRVRIKNGVIYYNGEVYLTETITPPATPPGYVTVFKNIPASLHPTAQIMGSGLSFNEFRPYVIFTQPGGTICIALESYAQTQEYAAFPLEVLSGRLRVSG